jgi:uncharacterized protein YndB with AHSA1/START domain
MTEKRSIDLQVEVPGTPEEVWDAIATGPGISVWFVPSDVEEREGGTITMHHGEGMDETGVVTAWDPPRRFAWENEFRPTEDATAERLALEMLVEARSGDTCVVRLVHSGFGTGADWDHLREGNEAGWRMCLRTLQLYLTHFRRQPSKRIHVMGVAPGSEEEAWAALTGELGMRDVAVGDPVAPGAPAFAGYVEHLDQDAITLRLEKPAPGIGIVAAGAPADVAFTQLAAVLFGDDAEAIAAREQPAWQAWMNEHFPLPHDTRLGVG